MSWETFYLFCFWSASCAACSRFWPAPRTCICTCRADCTACGHGARRQGIASLADQFRNHRGVSGLVRRRWIFAQRYSSIWALLALGLALVSGLGGAALVFWFLFKVLLKHDATWIRRTTKWSACSGSVSSTVREDGTGEMIFSQNGVRRAASARSEDGGPMAKGAEVVVTRYERGIAYVRRGKRSSESSEQGELTCAFQWKYSSIAGLMVLAIMFLMAMFARLYRKAGPHEALVVYGFRGTRIVKGRGTVIFPMIESCRELSLQLMSFDVAPQQDLYTKQGVAVTVEAVAQIKVKSDPESIKTASEQFLTKTDQDREALIRLVMEGHLRGIIGQLSVEQIVKEPEMVGDRMRATCADDMSKMGLEVISFTIKEVRDKNEYITNMGRPDVARIKRDADVATAEAERDTAIKRAEAMRAAAVAKAQADQERVLAETLSQAKQAEAKRDLEIKKAQLSGSHQETAGAGRQSLRHPDQHHAAAGDCRTGEDPAGGEGAGDQGAGGGN